MFVAGGLVYLNVKPHKLNNDANFYGWPIQAATNDQQANLNFRSIPEIYWTQILGIGFSWPLFAVNIVIVTLLLGCVAIGVEWPIRSRETGQTWRQIFQIHLRTGFVAFMVVALLLWLNIRGDQIYEQASPHLYVTSHGYQRYGWPCPILARKIIFLDEPRKHRKIDERVTTSDGDLFWIDESLYFLATGCCNFFILLSAVISVEWRIRRREARKP